MTWNGRRALAAASFGLVWVAALLGALATYPDHVVRHDWPLHETVKDVNELGQVVERFRSERGAYPGDWEELREWGVNRGLELRYSQWSLKEDEVPQNYWGKPLEYETLNGQPTIRSLGKDGLRSGSGWDQDIQWPSLGELQPVYTLAEFAREYLTFQWLLSTYLADGAAAALTLVPLHRRELRNPIPDAKWIVLRCVAISVLAGLAAAALSWLQVLDSH